MCGIPKPLEIKLACDKVMDCHPCSSTLKKSIENGRKNFKIKRLTITQLGQVKDNLQISHLAFTDNLVILADGSHSYQTNRKISKEYTENTKQ